MILVVAVLTGTKYGVRQTRGKFGLGSKMVLIWSKMSTGLPISIVSSRSTTGSVSDCVLDIDLHKNAPKVPAPSPLLGKKGWAGFRRSDPHPKVIRHEQRPNKEGLRGSMIHVTIAGNWTTYRVGPSASPCHPSPLPLAG